MINTVDLEIARVMELEALQVIRVIDVYQVAEVYCDEEEQIYIASLDQELHTDRELAYARLDNIIYKQEKRDFEEEREATDTFRQEYDAGMDPYLIIERLEDTVEDMKNKLHDYMHLITKQNLALEDMKERISSQYKLIKELQDMPSGCP